MFKLTPGRFKATYHEAVKALRETHFFIAGAGIVIMLCLASLGMYLFEHKQSAAQGFWTRSGGQLLQ